MNDQIPDASKEAIVKAKEAAEAIEISRSTQMQDMLDRSDERITGLLSKVLKNVFGEYENSGRFIDAAKIPLICQQINQLHDNVASIQDNIKWAARIIIGAVILALLALVLKSGGTL